MKITHETLNICDVKKNPGNPRIIKDERYKKLLDSVKKADWMLNIRQIVIDDNGYCMGGNMRLAACAEAGIEKINAVRVTGLSEEQKKEFIIKDNIGFGEWDWEILANDEEWNKEKLEEWGLEFDGLDKNNQDDLDFDSLDDFEVKEEIETNICVGDLIEIGEHRLLCGDSTNIQNIDKLLDGNSVDLMITDPPYNVDYKSRSGKHDKIVNDNISKEDFEDFIKSFSSIVKSLVINNYYIFCNWKFYGVLQELFDFNSCIVWNKKSIGMGCGYRNQHEFCLFSGEIDEHIKNESNVWDISRYSTSSYSHPTKKPVELFTRALGNHKNSMNIIDLFTGSGSSLVASHKLNRRFFGMELSPKYCKNIIDRMLKLDKEVTVKINGVSYENTV